MNSKTSQQSNCELSNGKKGSRFEKLIYFLKNSLNMRLLTSVIVASAQIFGTRIGNFSHVRTGNKHLRAKPIGKRKKKKQKKKNIFLLIFFFDLLRFLRWRVCDFIGSVLNDWYRPRLSSMKLFGYEDPRILIAQARRQRLARRTALKLAKGSPQSPKKTKAKK
jgi:hypothetical protein